MLNDGSVQTITKEKLFNKPRKQRQIQMHPQSQMSFQHSSVYNPPVGLCGFNYSISYGQNLNSPPFAFLQAENRNLKAEMNVISTLWKWEHFARQNQAAQLKSVLQREKRWMEENNRLIAKNATLTNSLKFAKNEIADLELQLKKEVKARETEAFQLKTISQNVQQTPACNDELLAKNSLLRDSLKTTKNRLEHVNSKQEKNKLEDQLCKLKSDLEQRIAEVNALTAVNEMLLHGNETRDETIKKLNKKLKKFINLSSSSDSDSILENTTPSPSAPLQQPRRFGCKALHALSSLGAENTLGPWLCLPCGINESPINFLSYSEFHRHLTEVHKEAIDPALCALCGWRSDNERELQLHTYKKHQIDALFHTSSKSAILGI